MIRFNPISSLLAATLCFMYCSVANCQNELKLRSPEVSGDIDDFRIRFVSCLEEPVMLEIFRRLHDQGTIPDALTVLQDVEARKKQLAAYYTVKHSLSRRSLTSYILSSEGNMINAATGDHLYTFPLTKKIESESIYDNRNPLVEISLAGKMEYDLEIVSKAAGVALRRGDKDVMKLIDAVYWFRVVNFPFKINGQKPLQSIAWDRNGLIFTDLDTDSCLAITKLMRLVNFDSDPVESEVKISGHKIFTTVTPKYVPQGKHNVLYSKDGYETKLSVLEVDDRDLTFKEVLEMLK